MALRVAATAMTFALGGVAIGMPHAGPKEAAPAVIQEFPAWQSLADKALDAKAVADRIDLDRMRAAESLKWAKLDLQLEAKAATEAFAASAGKASEEARRALAIERNRATTAVSIGESVDEVTRAAETLAPAATKVAEEVKAWEIAEAARKAEEERKAREAAAAAARSHRGGSRSGSAPSGDPKAYLDGIAAAWGASIQWGPTACGYGSSTSVAGCFAGGSVVIVNNAAYQSWSVAKGRGRNVVLHEISHMVIQRTCGTVYVSDRFENVTDAYALLIGAGATTGYGYNDTDMALAKAIKGGSCSL